MCLLCGGCPSKMVLKNMRWKKNKKHWVGLSVGSNVLLKYGLYVVCHLSKWFTFSSLFNGHFLLCRVVIRLQLTVRGFARERIFSTYAQSKSQTSNLAKMLIQSTSPALLQNRCYLLTFICQFPRISHSNQKPRQCHYLTLFFAPFFLFSILRFYC